MLCFTKFKIDTIPYGMLNFLISATTSREGEGDGNFFFDYFIDFFNCYCDDFRGGGGNYLFCAII